MLPRNHPEARCATACSRPLSEVPTATRRGRVIDPVAYSSMRSATISRTSPPDTNTRSGTRRRRSVAGHIRPPDATRTDQDTGQETIGGPAPSRRPAFPCSRTCTRWCARSSTHGPRNRRLGGAGRVLAGTVVSTALLLGLLGSVGYVSSWFRCRHDHGHLRQDHLTGRGKRSPENDDRPHHSDGGERAQQRQGMSLVSIGFIIAVGGIVGRVVLCRVDRAGPRPARGS